MAVFPSDHYIQDKEQFIAVVKTGCQAAAEGWLVTLGIKPTRPETGFGYVRRGETAKLSGKAEKGVYVAAGFTEKPDVSRARQYLESGDYYWNSGVFIFTAGNFLAHLKKFLPKHYDALSQIKSLGNIGKNKARYEEIYSSMEKISLDYGIMERADKVAVIPADVGMERRRQFYGPLRNPR